MPADSESKAKFRCPSCGGFDTRRSYPRGIFDALMGAFHKLPFRCRGCAHRFYRYMAPEAAPAEPAAPAGGSAADRGS